MAMLAHARNEPQPGQASQFPPWMAPASTRTKATLKLMCRFAPASAGRLRHIQSGCVRNEGGSDCCEVHVHHGAELPLIPQVFRKRVSAAGLAIVAVQHRICPNAENSRWL